jgi:hypothetical protein
VTCDYFKHNGNKTSLKVAAVSAQPFEPRQPQQPR